MLPGDPAELAGDPVRAAQILDDAETSFAGADELVRDTVGCNHEEWRTYTQPSGISAKWNLASLYVQVSLGTLAGRRQQQQQQNASDERGAVVDAPPGLGLDVIQSPQSLLDFHDICLSVAAHWRKNTFDEPFWRAVRALETELAAVIAAECPAPDAPNVHQVVDMCSIVSYLWAEEYLLRDVLPPVRHEAPVDAAREAALVAWAEREREHVLGAKISMKRPVLGAEVVPDELERYARNNGGIFASDLMTAVEDTRPYVANKALAEAIEDVDLTLGCGVVVMHLVNRFLVSTLTFPWVTHNVFIDTEFMSAKKHMGVRHRTQPWILLLGARWFVTWRGECWHTTSPYRAILLWWDCFRQQAPDGHFHAGWEEWVLTEFPPCC